MNTATENVHALISSYFDADHDRLDQLFTQFVSSLSSNKQKANQYFQAFHGGLVKHIEWEEEVLFPWFEKLSGITAGGPTHVMRHEHQLIKQALSKISSKLINPESDLSTEINELLGVLQQHNAKEENVLYPMLDKLCDEETVGEIFLQMSEF